MKPYWGGNGGTVLSPKLLPVLSKGRQSEDEPQASKPSKSIHLLSSTFEANICGQIRKVYMIDLVTWHRLVQVDVEVQC